MISLPDKLLARAQRLAPKSIVARTTFAIFALATVLGLIFAGSNYRLAHQNERARLEQQLHQLLSTVESSARIACFLNDHALAKEISLGLLRNKVVARVRIDAGTATLYEGSQPDTGRASYDKSGVTRISRTITSPFNPAETVGELSLYPSYVEIDAYARAYSLHTALVSGVQMTFIAAGVAIMVFLLVTRPIKSISDELHRLHLTEGKHLNAPRGNNADEIGRLVTDVNALIKSLTNLLARERELRIEHEMNERRMRLIFDKAAAGIFLLTADGQLQSWNPAFLRILGLRDEGSQVNRPSLQALLTLNTERVRDLIQRARSADAPCEIDLEVPADETRKASWIELSLNRIAPDLLQGVINDVTDHKRAELSAQQLATHDALTGLLNRHGIDLGLGKIFDSPANGQAPTLALFQIDLDYFKQVNDSFGHEAGDSVLRSVAKTLERCVRRSDLVGRWGGDEFVVILPSVSSAEKAEQIANNMIDGISRPIDVGNGHWAHVSASIGIAFSSVGDSPEALLHRADSAMYSAKHQGRSRSCISPETTLQESA